MRDPRHSSSLPSRSLWVAAWVAPWLAPRLAPWLTAVGVLILAGCVPEEPPPPPPPPPPPAAAAPPPAIKRDPVGDLLFLAQMAIKDNRLTSPAGRNALEYVDRAKNLDPTRAEIPKVTAQIVNAYLSLADRALDRGSEASARDFLRRARAIDSKHSGVEATESRIAALANTAAEVHPLDANALTAKSPAMVTELKQLGSVAKKQNLFVFINARNDAEGRWIYQQLAQGDGATRVRGQIAISASPNIEFRKEKPTCAQPC